MIEILTEGKVNVSKAIYGDWITVSWWTMKFCLSEAGKVNIDNEPLQWSTNFCDYEKHQRKVKEDQRNWLKKTDTSDSSASPPR